MPVDRRHRATCSACWRCGGRRRAPLGRRGRRPAAGPPAGDRHRATTATTASVTWPDWPAVRRRRCEPATRPSFIVRRGAPARRAADARRARARSPTWRWPWSATAAALAALGPRGGDGRRRRRAGQRDADRRVQHPRRSRGRRARARRGPAARPRPARRHPPGRAAARRARRGPAAAPGPGWRTASRPSPRRGFARRRARHAGMCLHDPLAVAVALDPTLVDWEAVRLEVEPRRRNAARGRPAELPRRAARRRRRASCAVFLERLCPAS